MNTNRLTGSIALLAIAATMVTGATAAHAEELDDLLLAKSSSVSTFHDSTATEPVPFNYEDYDDLLQLKASTVHTFSSGSTNRTSPDIDAIVERMERLLGAEMTMQRASKRVGNALGLNESPVGFGYTPVVSAIGQKANTGTYGDVTSTVTAPGKHRAGRTAKYRVTTTPGMPGTVVFVLARTNASGSESVVKRTKKALNSQGTAVARMKVGKKAKPGTYRVYALVDHDEFMYDFIVSDVTKVKR